MGALEGLDAEVDSKYKFWRIAAWFGTWLAYAGFYLGRKAVSVASPEMMKEFGWQADKISFMIGGYLWAYAFGQFINGFLGDKLGSRVMLALGFCITITMNLLFGFSSSFVLFFLVWTVNGYGQSVGWPSVIKVMSNWFSVRERGKIMGLWGTCYTVGDVVATALASFIIGHAAVHTVLGPGGKDVTYSDWRWAFWVASALLVVVGITALSLIRNRPEDKGLPPIAGYQGLEEEKSAPEEKVDLWKNAKEVLGQGPIWVLGITYFGIKYIRYSFLFLIATYLATQKHFSTENAGYTSTLFAFAGIAGTFLGSYLSDKVFSSRRAPISVIMLLGLCASLVFFWKSSGWGIPVAMCLVGFFAMGPDFVVSAVAVMDYGSRKGAGTAAGFVNGLGSFGPAVMATANGFLLEQGGWNYVFMALILLSLLCAGLMTTLWTSVGKN